MRPDELRRSVEALDTVAVLGCGTLGEMLVSGLIDSGTYSAGDVLVTTRSAEHAALVARRYGVRSAANLDAVEAADVIVFAVKPKDLPGVLEEVSKVRPDKKVFISVAAGVSISSIESRLGSGASVVRAMPNVGAAVRKSMTAMCPGGHAGDAEKKVAERIFASVGKFLWVKEDEMDAVTALSGSGPAYFAQLAEAMAAAGRQLGLAEQAANDLVVNTLEGTAAVLSQTGMPPGELQKKVASPGGTTEAALAEFERLGFLETVAAAVMAAAERSKRLRT